MQKYVNKTGFPVAIHSNINPAKRWRQANRWGLPHATLLTNASAACCIPIINSFFFHIFRYFRPGFVRINLPYFMSDRLIDFVLNAINMVATHGWKLLPQVCKYA